jgi:hypothetical protein
MQRATTQDTLDADPEEELEFSDNTIDEQSIVRLTNLLGNLLQDGERAIHYQEQAYNVLSLDAIVQLEDVNMVLVAVSIERDSLNDHKDESDFGDNSITNLIQLLIENLFYSSIMTVILITAIVRSISIKVLNLCRMFVNNSFHSVLLPIRIAMFFLGLISSYA